MLERPSDQNSSSPKCDVAHFCPGASADAISSFKQLCRIPTRVLCELAAFELKKPYGRSLVLTPERNYGVFLVEIEPGKATSLHFHRIRHEAFFVRQGTLTLHLQKGIVILNPGELSGSKPPELHRLSNEGSGTLQILEFFVPNSIDDIVRLYNQ